MARNTTIQIDEKTLERIKKNKEYPRQTYNELLMKILDFYETMKKKKPV